MNRNKILIVLVIAALVGLFFHYDLGHYLSLAYLKSSQAQFQTYYQANPAQTIAIYMVIYIVATALSLPGAAILTLAGGALFGLVTGTILVSFASSIGATLAFLASRFLLRDWVNAKFGSKLGAINDGVAKDGAFYLFMMRLVPAFPFFLINLLMGITKIPALTFYGVSQIGMLAGTVVFVNAGTQLAQIDSLRGILSPGLLGSFALLGIFPLIARKIVQTIQDRKIYARWPKPAKFDRNIIVIGGGSAGLVTSIIGAAVKAKVTLVEGHKMGGDCLNFGCVPSKALIRSAKFVHTAKNSQSIGIAKAETEFSFADVMARVHRVIKTIEPHDSAERFISLGVDVIQGHAKIISPWEVEIDVAGKKQRLTTRAIVIATGARPFVPPIPGINDVGFYTSDTLWEMTELPPRLIVLGGGPIGCELAQSFARLGSKVTQVEMAPKLMIREDADASKLVTESLIADGVNVLVNHQAIRCEMVGDGPNAVKRLIVKHQDKEIAIEFDQMLCAVGRVARTEGFGLEELGIPTTPRKTIATDDYLQTLYPNIFACGDVAGPFQFTHTAAHQAYYAAVNALFGNLKRSKVDYSVIPWATFTDPEVARVGLSEAEAKEKGIAVEVTQYGIDDLDRAIADETAHGFVKVLTPPGKDTILGVTIVGEHAAELLAEFVLAMKWGLGLNKILGTIHTYPTMSEANKYAAGEWRKAHAPQGVLQWLEKYHTWRRN
jgi:pyruvate/2-oxoglutarate dehydrogenase complex dihydrolipoamide dehydrogenase (E3) component/uncharacterized membrane protein YdjX (TVP38/TMEM64 family)